MTHTLLRRGGISALACVEVAEHDDASSSSPPLLPCTFQVKHSDYDLQATFSLQCRIHIDGFDHEQSFVLLYHADNLVTGTPSCEAATRTLLPTQLAQIARDTRPEVKALSLNLVNPCSILCPDVAESIAPKYGHYTSFYQLVNLAKATEVTILFDWKWLLPARQQPFVDVVSQPQRYSAFPVDNRNLKGRRLEDWTVFAPVEDNASNNGSPPSYAETAGKRPRQASTSSSNSPPSKRILYSPLLIPVGSPTEKATTTTASIPSPKAPFSPIADHLHTSLAAAIRPIMKEMLPEMLTELMNQPHSFSSTPPPTLSHPLLSSPSPTATPQLPSSSTLRALRTLLTARAATYVEAKLRTICADTADEAHLLRTTTDDEFLDIIANHKLDCQLSTNDTLAEAQQDMDDKLRAFQDKTNDIIAEAEEQVELLERSSHEKLQAQINKLEQDSRDNLKAQMETLERETRDKLRAVWQQTRVRHDRIRAASI